MNDAPKPAVAPRYRPTIGVEIHCQLSTKSKMFCACNNDSVGVPPNVHICPICLGFPGSLPTINRRAVDYAVKLGLGLNATIADFTKFDRKNYFYPDLPKGYQISQFDLPIVYDGSVEIFVDGSWRTIGIERAHLEEDAAKLIHPPGRSYSLVDFNRGGTPLIEIVSKPDMHSPAEARRYLQEVYNIAMSLGITHGNMEEGNFKFDLNVSVSDDPHQFGSKVELKNLNSFRNAERALRFEIQRQTEILSGGGRIEQETRGWDDVKSRTVSQRSKEEANDYRYFPEPDLPPLVISKAMVEQIRDDLPTMPLEIRRNLVKLNVSVDDQDLLISQPHTLRIFNDAAQTLAKPELIKKAVNWLVGDYQSWLSQRGVSPDTGSAKSQLSGQNLAQLIQLVENGQISGKIAKQIFADVAEGESPADLVASRNLGQISDQSQLAEIVRAVVAAHPQAKSDYQSGKQNALGFLVGQVMKQTQGQASPTAVNELLRQELNR